jgi:hypothetical protein
MMDTKQVPPALKREYGRTPLGLKHGQGRDSQAVAPNVRMTT